MMERRQLPRDKHEGRGKDVIRKLEVSDSTSKPWKMPAVEGKFGSSNVKDSLICSIIKYNSFHKYLTKMDSRLSFELFSFFFYRIYVKFY